MTELGTTAGTTGDDGPDPTEAVPSDILRHPARLTALRRLALLDTPAELAFDRLTRLATKILGAPIALLSLVDGERSFFKSSVGLPEPWASRREMPLSHSVCQHVIGSNAPLVVNDARAHLLVSDNKAVAELRIVAYLGIPLVTSEQQVLGTLAVIRTVPAEWSPDDVSNLTDLAASAMSEIELRSQINKHLLVERRLFLMESVAGNTGTAALIVEAEPAEPSDPKIVFVNEAYTRLTGYSQEDVVGKSHRVLNCSLNDRSQIDAVRAALESWKPARLRFLAYRKDGSTFWGEWNIIPITDDAGRYSHWVVIKRDVSREMAAEEALRESEARRQAILECAPDCIITLDDQERVLEFNPAAERTFGYSRTAVLGKPMAELVLPHAGEGPALGLVRYLPSDKDFLLQKRLEMTAVRVDGTKFPVELAFTIIRLKGPVFTAFLRDITERERADEAIRRSEERFRRFFELGLVGMAFTTPGKVCTAVNDELCRILGYDRGELLEKKWSDMTHPDDLVADVVEFERMLGGASDGYVLDKRWVRKDGRVIDSTISVRCQRREDGAVDYFVSLLQDVTETRRLQRELQGREKLLEEKVRERTLDLEVARLEILQRLSLAAEFRDDDTCQHTQRVGRVSALLAQTLGLPDERVHLFRLAATLHDVGKIGISDAILLKPGALTPEEHRTMTTHTSIGSRILSGSQSPLLQLAEEIALTHHECWDGTGYPLGRRGEGIPLAGRIVSVADVFDALTHQRPYKKAWPVRDATAEIERLGGSKFDPQVVGAFLQLIREGLLDNAPTIGEPPR